MGVLELWDLHNERMERLIRKEIVYVTYQKDLESQRHLKDFIRHNIRCQTSLSEGLKSALSKNMPATSEQSETSSKGP